MKVRIPGPLRSYTKNRSEVEAHGSTLADVLDDLDREYPGVRFRMIDEQGQVRQHIRLFINTDKAESLSASVQPADEIQIICALSGGQK